MVARAVTLAARAVRLTSAQDPLAFETLAAASAQAGRAPDAVAAIDRALALVAVYRPRLGRRRRPRSTGETTRDVCCPESLILHP